MVFRQSFSNTFPWMTLKENSPFFFLTKMHRKLSQSLVFLLNSSIIHLEDLRYGICWNKCKISYHMNINIQWAVKGKNVLMAVNQSTMGANVNAKILSLGKIVKRVRFSLTFSQLSIHTYRWFYNDCFIVFIVLS